MRHSRLAVVLTMTLLFFASAVGLDALAEERNPDLSERKTCVGTLADNYGRSTYSSPSRIRFKRLPEFEMVTAIPDFMEPLSRPFVPLVCLFNPSNDRVQVANAKGRFTLDLFVLDHRARTFERFEIYSGKFKTAADGPGRSEILVDIRDYAAHYPAEDVSIWFFTRARYKKKAGTWASVSCGFREAPAPSAALLPKKPIEGYQACSSGGTYVTTDRCRLSQFPLLESVVPVPRRIDPSERPTVHVGCRADAYDGSDPIPNARGRFATTLYLLDHPTGTFGTVPIGSGPFKTQDDGFGHFDSELATELFADGFESGDTSAWVHTRTEFTSKEANFGSSSCEITD